MTVHGAATGPRAARHSESPLSFGRGLAYTDRVMTPLARLRLLIVAAALALPATGPGQASAQAFVPSAASHPMLLLGASLDYPDLLLTPPRAHGFLDVAAPLSRDGEMAAYRAFEIALRERTAGIASPAGPSKARKEAGRKLLADLSDEIASWPGGSVLMYGKQIWERVQDTTRFEIDGYRLRLQVDDAVDGKLAIKVQKRFR